jgi:23S rRNA (cytidine1920-2'-O)/16S rRNA (cytidine1409-2'-O)-methyltransferase
MEERIDITEERLDKVLIQRGLVSTRVRAEEIIRKHGVMVNGKLLNKTGKRIPLDAKIELLAEESAYVSRGAIKLVHALSQFQISPKGKIAMDIGASTGGFTEVLLENDVTKVYCVDVGTKQLHEKIKSNEKVINLEKTNVRELNQRMIPEMCNFAVVDVSFISLGKVFPFLHAFVEQGSDLIALIKPQFEVGKENVGKGGIVKNKTLYPKVIHDIKVVARQNNFEYVSHMDSPILGGDGNKEFLGHFRRM